MNRQHLQAAASQWESMAKQDLKNKVYRLLDENNWTIEDLAYNLCVTRPELQNVIDGTNPIPVSLFAKVIIASGFVLEVKPLSETPFANVEDIPAPQGVIPPYPPYGMPPIGAVPPPPMRERFESERPRTQEEENGWTRLDEEERPRPHRPFGEHRSRRFAEAAAPSREDAPQSKFRTMTREQLVNIIKEHLWDSEIDTNGASWEALVRFLEAKDKRIRRYSEDNEGKIEALTDKLKNAMKHNPRLQKYLESVV